jgi:putative spermidine/putrescine transport system permease protein
MQNNFQLLPIRISEQFVGDVVQRKEFGSALAVVLMLMMVATIAANGMILKKRGGRG